LFDGCGRSLGVRAFFVRAWLVIDGFLSWFCFENWHEK